jgi:hypothetical protein
MGSDTWFGNVARRSLAAMRAWLVVAFAAASLAASADALAAKKDTSMCDGLKGAAKGFCTAAAALGCGASTKHQAQCDALGDKFEALTGDTPPWEVVEPPPPPPPPPPADGTSVTLGFDSDALDLDTGMLCVGALGAECNAGDTEFIVPPNDFWMSFDAEQPGFAVFVPVLACDQETTPGATAGIAVLLGVPFASVDGSVIGTVELSENIIEASIGPNDTIVIRTCDEGYFKVGVVSLDAFAVTLVNKELEF